MYKERRTRATVVYVYNETDSVVGDCCCCSMRSLVFISPPIKSAECDADMIQLLFPMTYNIHPPNHPPMIPFVCVLFQREKRETQHVRSAANEIYSLSFFFCLFDVNFRALVFFFLGSVLFTHSFLVCTQRKWLMRWWALRSFYLSTTAPPQDNFISQLNRDDWISYDDY